MASPARSYQSGYPGNGPGGRWGGMNLEAFSIFSKGITGRVSLPKGGSRAPKPPNSSTGWVVLRTAMNNVRDG
jgi:hypothetical protein